jgi:simple sugar transport system permease protein
MNNIKKLISKPLFLPIFCMLLVMAVNIIYDVASGNFAFNFFTISIRNGVLYGRMIDILNRGSEIAILAIGMTLVVSCSAGTDISVGSVMSLAASFCCMLLAGYGVSSTNELARPLIIGVLGGILIGCVCGAFNGFLVQTALGLYVQSVGINKKASRIAGIKSERIIFLCYIVCGLCAGIAGIVASSRISSADSNNIGLNFELDAILAVALGGNSLGGGKFRLTGSIIGAYTIQAITTTLYALGVSTEQAPVYKAVIVIIIVAIQAPPFKDYMKKMSAKRQLAKGGVA